jgi:hypothetical protein
MVVVGRLLSTCRADPIPGSISGECSICAAPILLAPSSQRVVGQRYCIACAMAAFPDASVTMAPGAQEELSDYLLRGRRN